jgi:hypothetical protein
MQSLKDFVGFLVHKKKWVLAPIAIVLLLMAVFILLAEIPVLTPFIYALF